MTRIFKVDSPHYADLTVRVVNTPAMADLVVYRDDEAVSEAHGEELWTFVDSRENAHIAVFFTPKGMTYGHVTVAFTTDRKQAGWQKFHQRRGNLDNSKRKYAAVTGQTAYWGR